MVLAAAVAACSLRAPRTTATASPCSSTAQCGSGVCFLGECRPAAANLSGVLVEVRPSDPTLAVRQFSIDLRTKPVYDFALKSLYSGSGTVTQDTGGGVAGAVVTFTERSPLIPDHVDQVQVSTGSAGDFKVQLAQGIWDVTVVPPAPGPPYRTALDTSQPNLAFRLPAPLQTWPLGLALPDGGPVPAASITAVDSVGGVALSAPALQQADGGYALILPPASTLPAYLMQVGPAPADGGPAAARPVVPTFVPQAVPAAGGVAKVDLPPEVQLSGTVVDLVHPGNPVAGARVYARSDNAGWMLARSAVAASDGSYSLTLLTGQYEVEAAPAAGDPFGVSDLKASVKVPASAPLQIACPPKVFRSGLVLTPDGRPAGANYQVTATRVPDPLLTTRTAATTPTDASGVFHIVADPGVYRVEVVPPASSGFPRKLISYTFQDTSGVESSMGAITLSPPLNVAGTVTGPVPPGASSGPVIAGATVSFYALDALGQHSIFIGSALTDSSGQYDAVLPDVQNPGP